MYYTDLKDILPKLSLFDLYRLNLAINHELEHASKIRQIHNSIEVGSVVEYLDATTNCMVNAIVIQKNIKRLLVRNCQDQKEWWVKYHMLNLSMRLVKPMLKKLSRSDASVGDMVGFEHNGTKVMGEVIKLNPKTATVRSHNNLLWKVSYNLLFPTIEATQHLHVIDI